MTALASFCVGDRWLDGLPVDEVVPMIFRMGTDNERIRSFLAAGNDFQDPMCRTSYGNFGRTREPEVCRTTEALRF